MAQPELRERRQGCVGAVWAEVDRLRMEAILHKYFGFAEVRWLVLWSLSQLARTPTSS
jgi:hypothetical protein